MTVKYTVKCQKCGKTRDTYNDPRLRRSVIECKASCFESHYEWEFVEEFDESATSASAAPALVAPPPPRATAAGESVPASSTANAVSPNDASPPPARKNAFAEKEDNKTSPAPPAPAPATSTSDKKTQETERKEPPVTKKSSGICVML